MTNATTPPSLTLAPLWEEYRDRSFLFVKPGGNAGDQLIYWGAEALARHLGLSFETVGHDRFMDMSVPAETVVYIHGGGGHNPIWSGKPMIALTKAAQHEGVVIQGPATYWDDPTFLAENVTAPLRDAQCERVVMMAREKVSAGLIRSAAPPGVETLLDHDTAFNVVLEREALDAYRPSSGGGYRYYAIRTDREARAEGARHVAAAWGDPVTLAPDPDDWLRLHAGAAALITNRLHSSIAGFLLGVPTTLTPNSYFKNRAVWEFSLRERGVAWSDEVPIPEWSRLLSSAPLLGSLLSRGSVTRWVRRLSGVEV